MSTDTNVKSLVLNKMTKAQYDALSEKSPNELYLVSGDKIGTNEIEDSAVTEQKIDPTVLENVAYIGEDISTPSDLAYVRTENIVDGAVTADKTDRVILWQGTDNGTSSITLSETAANFKYIEVYYRDDQSFKNSIRIFTNNSANAINFCLQNTKTGGSGDTVYLTSKRENLQGTLLTQGYETATTLRNSTAVSLALQTNYMRIEQIIGYRS